MAILGILAILDHACRQLEQVARAVLQCGVSELAREQDGAVLAPLDHRRGRVPRSSDMRRWTSPPTRTMASSTFRKSSNTLRREMSSTSSSMVDRS